MKMNDDSDRSGSARFAYSLILVIFTAVSVCAILQSRPLQSANDRSRWSTVLSLVERGTYAIDEIDSNPEWRTIDKVRHEGHFYSSKPPLFPTLVAGLYWVQRHTIGLSLYKHPLEVTRILLLLVNFVPFFVSLLLMIRLAERHLHSFPARIMAVTLMAFATMLTSFQTTLNNHSLGANCLFFSLYCASRVLCDNDRRTRWFVLTGFFAALTCTAELPAALFGLSIFGLMAIHDFRKTLTIFVPAALVPLAGFFITNWIATGGWKPFYMYYGTEKYLYVVDGVPSYWHQPHGLDRNTESTWTYLMHCVIGHHGVLSLTPVFLLSMAGWWTALRSKSTALRPIILLGAFLSVSVLAFYLTRTQNYNYGGNSAALRWMLWLVPFWLLAMMPVLDRYWQRAWFRRAVFVMLAVSIYSVGTSLGNPWRHPWLYNVMANARLINYSVPPPPLDHPRQTWVGSLPKTSAAWVEFSSLASQPGKSANRIRLTWDAGEPDDDVGIVRVDRNDDPSVSVPVLISAFNRGAPAKEFLRDDQPLMESFLTGMPKSRDYQPGVVRYVVTKIRPNAFRCQRAASRVVFTTPMGQMIHRCDVWLTNQLPFGVAQVEFTVTNSKDSAIVRRERWIATSCSEIIDTDENHGIDGDG